MGLEPTEHVQRAIAGDREALDELWRRHRGWLAVVVLAHKPAGLDLDDLLQEVAMAMVRNINTVREPGQIRAWLRQVAINTVRTACRRLNAGPITTNGQVDVEDERPPGGSSSALPEDAHTAMNHIMALPVIYREPFLLRGVRGLTVPHIAEAMELPIKTVETRILRARRMLIKALTTTSSSSEAAPTGTPR